MRALAALLCLALAAGCAGSSDVRDDPRNAALAALEVLSAQSRARAPRAGFDAPLTTLHEALVALGADIDDATRRATAPPQRDDPHRSEPPARPSPEDLDRRQRDLGSQLPAGPGAAQRQWRQALGAGYANVRAALDARPLDYARLDRALAALRRSVDAPEPAGEG